MGGISDVDGEAVGPAPGVPGECWARKETVAGDGCGLGCAESSLDMSSSSSVSLETRLLANRRRRRRKMRRIHVLLLPVSRQQVGSVECPVTAGALELGLFVAQLMAPEEMEALVKPLGEAREGRMGWLLLPQMLGTSEGLGRLLSVLMRARNGTGREGKRKQEQSEKRGARTTVPWACCRARRCGRASLSLPC